MTKKKTDPEKSSGKKLPDGCVATQKEVAKAFRVTLRTIGFWIAEGMPVTPEGWYDLEAIRTWKRDREAARKNPRVEQKEQAQANYHDIKAKMMELEYKKRIGEVISVEDVKNGWVQRVLVVKRALLSLPRTLAPQVAGKDVKDCQAILHKRICEVIDGFSKS